MNDDNDNRSGPKVTMGGSRAPVRLRVGGDDVYFASEDEAERAAMMLLRIVNGGSILLDAYQRGETARTEYGNPEPNMTATAALMGEYVGRPGIDAFDASIMMVQMKVARLQTGERKRDTLTDVAGYARVAAECEGINDE